MPGRGGPGARDPEEPTRQATERKETGALIDRVTGRYDQFRQAVERTRTGDWSAGDFEAFLCNVYEVLTQKAHECRTLIEETQYRDEAPEEVDGGLRGIDLYEMGMQELWLFLHDGEAHHLEEGMRLIWDGNEKINEAMRLNRESREDLDVTFFL